MRGINRNVIFGGKIAQHLNNVVNQRVVVFRHRMGFDERIKGHEIDFVFYYRGLDAAGQRTQDGGAPTLIDGHELAVFRSGADIEEPALNVLQGNFVIDSPPLRFAVALRLSVVLQRNN